MQSALSNGGEQGVPFVLLYQGSTLNAYATPNACNSSVAKVAKVSVAQTRFRSLDLLGRCPVPFPMHRS